MAENQEHIEAQLCAYIDGELDAKGRAEIEKHLANNPQHQRLIAGLIESREMMRALPREKAPEDILESVQHALERSVLLAGVEDDVIAMPRRMIRGSHMMLAAAIVLLTIGLGVVIYFMLPSSGRQGEVAMVTPPGGPEKTAASSTRDIGGERLPRAEVAMKGGPTASKAGDRDPFTPRGGAENKVSQLQVVDALSNSNNFSDMKKDAADGHLVLVVDTDNPTVTNGQVTSYLVNNGIAWQKLSEPMPAPLEISQNQVVEMSRLNQTHVQLRAGNNQVAADSSLKLEQTVNGLAGATGGGGGGVASSQPAQTFTIAPTTSPTSPSEMVYDYFGFGRDNFGQNNFSRNNFDQSKASNRIVANMTRRQAEELSTELCNSRSGQRAMVYGRELYDMPARGALTANIGVDKAQLNYSLTPPRSSAPASPTAVASGATTQPSGGYIGKSAATPAQVSEVDEIASKEMEKTKRGVYPGGAKFAKEPAPATNLSDSVDVRRQKSLTETVAKADHENAPASQEIVAQQIPASQASAEEQLIDVFICVNADAVVPATQPTFDTGAASQPALEAP